MNTVTKFLQTTLPLLMLVFLASSQLMATTRYVKAGGSGGGTSWADAAGNLQTMINASNNGDEVWVAAGTYTPGINRTDAFVMKNGVAILGGFPNTGNPGIGARNWSANVTILSGEIGSTSTTTDNSYHVVYNSGLNRSAVLNGFTITGGDTSDPFGTGFGAGMYNENSSPSIINCIFTGNRIPFGSGAGMANSSSSPAIINCIFTGNSASVVGGGMGNFINSSPDIINCTFSGNSSGSASGIHNNNSTPNIINCIIWGNNFTGINGSPNVTHSIVQGGYGPCTDCPNGSGNADPLFVSTTNFQLQVCSPAIDAGDDTANTELTDFAGNARKFEAIPSGAMIDMGAYEYQSIVPLTTYYADTDGDTYGANVGQGFCTNPGAGWVLQAGDCDDNNPNVNPDALEVCDGVDNNCINGIDEGNTCCPGGNVLYVNDEASGLNNGTSWTDAFTDLQDALASTCPGVTEIWVAEGIYVPGTNQADEFEMKDGVDIYGGFPGSPGQEGNFGVRDWMTNVSILSGEIGVPGLGDNCTNVVIGATAVLDGFTIRGANADGMSVYFVLPTIANCVFTENGSDGIDGIASMQVRNCAFINNVENGVNTYGDDSIYTNCTFFGNGNYGTAFASGSFPTLVNCTYSGNNAGGLSGFIGVSPIVKNCIFWGDGGSEFLIVGGSADITNSIVQGGCPTGSVAYTCTNLLDIDPLFVDQVNGDLRLQECSPAIDAGDDSANSEATDLDGNDRTFEAIPGAPTIDMGAYEYQGTTPDPTPICTANLTVQLDVNTTVIVTAEQIGDSSDGCTPLSFLIDGENSLTFDCDDLGPQMVTLQVTDQFMNTATTTCSFTIADNNSYCCVAPVANCENFTAVLVGNSVTITTDDIDNGSTADCGLADFMVFPNTFGCDAVGTPQLVTLTITDINGDSDDCPATITVVDSTPPSITCPAAVTVECNEDTGPGSTGTATGSDNCSTPIITWNDLFASACGNTGVITRIWTATDASDNPSSCNQLITIVDNTPPPLSFLPTRRWNVAMPHQPPVQRLVPTVVERSPLLSAIVLYLVVATPKQSPAPGRPPMSVVTLLLVCRSSRW